MRDSHLKKEDYFNEPTFKTIRINSTKIEEGKKAGYFHFFGNLTIKGTTKPIDFEFSAAQQQKSYLFVGSFKIDRRQFKVGGNSFSLSDNVTIDLSILAK